MNAGRLPHAGVRGMKPLRAAHEWAAGAPESLPPSRTSTDTIMISHPTSITPANHIAMPVIGLGVLQSSPEETLQAVSATLVRGYRLIDPGVRSDPDPTDIDISRFSFKVED